MNEQLLTEWAKQLKLPGSADEWDIAVALMNSDNNYNWTSPIYLIMGMVATDDVQRAYVNKCAKWLVDHMKSWPPGTKLTVDWLKQFKEHYITEVDKL